MVEVQNFEGSEVRTSREAGSARRSSFFSNSSLRFPSQGRAFLQRRHADREVTALLPSITLLSMSKKPAPRRLRGRMPATVSSSTSKSKPSSSPPIRFLLASLLFVASSSARELRRVRSDLCAPTEVRN